ncbi:MAG: family 1 glycosylhydrolase [Elusimicrobiota bacterium]
MKFPTGFIWGASTAAYQIEGGNEHSALWDWERRKGWERSGAAAGSWERWRDDVACLKRLNLKAYRFSVEWSRIEPRPGEFDERALARYREMVRALKDEGIRPIVCLHHFSEPAWLFAQVPDGWLTPAAAGRGALAPAAELFIRFVDKVVTYMGGEVRDWLTFNEPLVWLLAGYGIGQFPPGRRSLLSLQRTFYGNYGGGGLVGRVARAHKEAYRIIHREVPEARVSIAQHIGDLEPAGDRKEDRDAVKVWERFMHARLLDLLHHDATLDFLGINYYTRIYVAASRLPFVPLGTMPGYAEVEELLGPRLFRWLGGRRGDRPRTDMGWEIVPEGLERVVKRCWDAYKLPILITENGLASTTAHGREDYLKSHLAALGRALASGVDVEGYLHWSLIDNYEWGSYRPKFGLFSVDRDNGLARTPASGAEYYAEVARTNRL